MSDSRLHKPIEALINDGILVVLPSRTHDTISDSSSIFNNFRITLYTQKLPARVPIPYSIISVENFSCNGGIHPSKSKRDNSVQMLLIYKKLNHWILFQIIKQSLS